jgi:electron transport complex protein RnfG
MTGLRESYLGQAWLVLVLALVFGGTLAGVQVGLQERIEANLRAETLGRIPSLLLGSEVDPDAEVLMEEDRLEVRLLDGSSLEIRVAEQVIGGHQVFEVTDGQNQQRLGWVARGAGQGYADQIEILIGLRPDSAEITGLYVLSQKETPALGDGITRSPFRDRFVGIPVDRPLEVARDETAAAAAPNRILALTAATISSQSVCDIVNRTVADIRPEIPQ